MGLALSLSVACGGDGNVPEPGNAFLTIVGDSNMFIDHSERRVLTVRYHDGDDLPLDGEVSFELGGDAGGATISAEAGFTNANGLVEITLNAGNIDAAFEIRAAAEHANSVNWNVAVGSPFSLAGAYDIDSNFDVISGMPGDLGNVLNTIVDMTDDPNDPGKYLVELLEDELGFSIPSFVDAIVNDAIRDNAPGLVNDLLDIADAFGQATRKFGTDSTFVVTEGSGAEGYVARHTMHGFHFRIDNMDFGFTNDELGEEDVEVANIGVSMNADKVTILAHDMPVQYGGFLAKALNEVIVPMIDPGSDSLKSLLQARIDCVAVGIALENNMPFGSASFYEGACETGISAGANAVIDQLIDIDERAQVTLKITGTARMQETNGDRKVDSLTQGKWSGAIDYLGEQGELTGDVNIFTGTRTTAEQ
jgi:hypothetical protein